MAMALLRRPIPPEVDGFASAERGALADAIADYAAREAERAASTAAEPKLDQAVWDARRNAEAAKAGLVLARGDAAAHLAAAARGHAGAPPVSVQAARAKLADAEDALEAAIAARDALKAELARVSDTPDFAAGRLRRAAIAVLRVEASETALALVAEVDRLQCDLVRKGTALQWLVEAGVFATSDEPGVTYGKIIDPKIARTVNRINSPSGSWNALHRVDALRGDGVWQAALEALMRDADATVDIGGGVGA